MKISIQQDELSRGVVTHTTETDGNVNVQIAVGIIEGLLRQAFGSGMRNRQLNLVNNNERNADVHTASVPRDSTYYSPFNAPAPLRTNRGENPATPSAVEVDFIPPHLQAQEMPV